MNILVSGARGLIGSALVPFLTTGGHPVTRLVRSQPKNGEAEVHWDPETGKIEGPGPAGIEAVVHLAGENIGAGKWTAAKKAHIRDSRVKGTRLRCEALTQLDPPPQIVVCASAIGYYGSRGEELLKPVSAIS